MEVKGCVIEGTEGVGGNAASGSWRRGEGAVTRLAFWIYVGETDRQMTDQETGVDAT